MERRQLLRNLPVKQRAHGMNAHRMNTSRRSIGLAISFLTIAGMLPEGPHKMAFMVLGVYYISLYNTATFTTHVPIRHFQRLDRRIRDYDEATFRLKFRFNKEHALGLMRCLDIPLDEDIICDNGSRFHPEEAFLILLRRMAVYNRLTDMEEEFGIEYTQLDRVFNAMVNRIVAAHHIKVFDNLAFFQPRFAMYNAAILNKILAGGNQLPAAALDTALFTDGTSLRVPRPHGNNHQAQLYNGHHKVHCLQWQGTSAPDGMIVDLFGPIPGRRHDQAVDDMSRLNERLAAVQEGNALQFKTYLDKGYINKTHEHVAYRGVDLPPQLQLENDLMAPQRVGIEWAFNRVCTEFAYIDHYKVQKIQLSAVGKLYYLSALLSNCYTCLYHSQASTYWNCPPPTLGQYFNVDAPF